MTGVPVLAAADYQPRLQDRFALLQARLGPLVPGAGIEHIGSSAVPGCVSKGDLDICVLVDASRHAAAVAGLVAAGYALAQDTLRTPELCMLEWHTPGEEHAVQLVARGSAFAGLFLAWRDRLRADPALVAQYNRLKHAAAPGGEDAYRAAKSRFIEQVLGARGPAARTG